MSVTPFITAYEKYRHNYIPGTTVLVKYKQLYRLEHEFPTMVYVQIRRFYPNAMLRVANFSTARDFECKAFQAFRTTLADAIAHPQYDYFLYLFKVNTVPLDIWEYISDILINKDFEGHDFPSNFIPIMIIDDADLFRQEHRMTEEQMNVFLGNTIPINASTAYNQNVFSFD